MILPRRDDPMTIEKEVTRAMKGLKNAIFQKRLALECKRTCCALLSFPLFVSSSKHYFLFLSPLQRPIFSSSTMTTFPTTLPTPPWKNQLEQNTAIRGSLGLYLWRCDRGLWALGGHIPDRSPAADGLCRRQSHSGAAQFERPLLHQRRCEWHNGFIRS